MDLLSASWQLAAACFWKYNVDWTELDTLALSSDCEISWGRELVAYNADDIFEIQCYLETEQLEAISSDGNPQELMLGACMMTEGLRVDT